MRGRPFPFWLATLVVLTTIFAAQAPAQVSEERQQALRAMAKALEPTVEKLRGLEFKRHVPKGIKSPNELRKFMLEELDREVSPEEMQASQSVMEKYGLIPKGLDHILFVLGLFFLAMRLRPLLWQISAFTLAHTITLAMGMLGLVTVPAAVVEPLIAASIVYVGVENVLTRGLSPWRPAVSRSLFSAGVASFGFRPGSVLPSLF